MISIDERTGSRELQQYFTKPTSIVRMEFGDFCFLGNHKDDMIAVGIERKTTEDFCSSLESGRLFGFQAPGLAAAYARTYVIVEGESRYGADGLLEKRRGRDWVPVETSRRFMASELSGAIMSLEEMFGFRVKFTSTPKATAMTIERMYAWWNKDWEDHQAHETIYCGPDPCAEGKVGFNKWTEDEQFVLRVAAQLPGIGTKKAKRVLEVFPSVAEMVMAPDDQWLKIDGIGKGLVGKIKAALWSETGKGK